MAHVGMFASDAGPVGDRITGLGGAMIHYESVNNAPILAMMGSKAERGFSSTSYEWTEQQKMTGINYVKQVSDGAAGLGSVLQLADASWVTEHMIFLVITTGEYLFVTGVSGNNITVVRGYGRSTVKPIIPTITRDIEIQRIGTAFHEGSERPVGVMFSGQGMYNVTQIFRNTWEVTRTAKMVKYKSGDIRERAKRDCLFLHTMDIEMSILFGIRSVGVHNGMPHRSFDGIYRQIRTNLASPAGGIMTERMLNTFFQVIFSQGIKGRSNNRRIAICGIGFITHINNLVRQSGNYQITARESSYGINVTEWVTPYGVVHFMPHDLLSNMPGRRNDLLVLHPDSVNIKFMYEGREEDTTENGKTNGIDGDIGGLISELTVALEGQLCCGLLTGVCGVAPDPLRVQMAEPYTPPVHPGC